MSGPKVGGPQGPDFNRLKKIGEVERKGVKPLSKQEEKTSNIGKELLGSTRTEEKTIPTRLKGRVALTQEKTKERAAFDKTLGGQIRAKKEMQDLKQISLRMEQALKGSDETYKIQELGTSTDLVARIGVELYIPKADLEAKGSTAPQSTKATVSTVDSMVENLYESEGLSKSNLDFFALDLSDLNKKSSKLGAKEYLKEVRKLIAELPAIPAEIGSTTF